MIYIRNVSRWTIGDQGVGLILNYMFVSVGIRDLYNLAYSTCFYKFSFDETLFRLKRNAVKLLRKKLKQIC